MQFFYGDSLGGVHSLDLPFDSRDDSAKQDAANAYRRSMGLTAGRSRPTLLPFPGHSQGDDLAEAA